MPAECESDSTQSLHVLFHPAYAYCHTWEVTAELLKRQLKIREMGLVGVVVGGG